MPRPRSQIRGPQGESPRLPRSRGHTKGWDDSDARTQQDTRNPGNSPDNSFRLYSYCASVPWLLESEPRAAVERDPAVAVLQRAD
jgi:hypothetical protein